MLPRLRPAPRPLRSPGWTPVALFSTAALLLASCVSGGIPRRPGPPPKASWVSYSDAELLGVREAHSYRGAPLCQRCHLTPRGELRTKVPELCYECHAAAKMTHVGKVQSPPPATLPYEAGGRITCHTCHDPHDVKANRYGFRAPFASICLECHKGH